MKIGIVGVGSIGKTLTQRLSAAGHEVKAANSRGPETIDPGVFSSGGRAVRVQEAMVDVDVLILSIPLAGIPGVAPLVAEVPHDVVIIDTSNYIPARDPQIAAIEAGQPESSWVVEQLGRSIVKAWNSIGSDSFSHLAAPEGTAGRIALPVAADTDDGRRVGMSLVEATGFDAVDAGSLADSWRQQPGSPSYCTDLSRSELLPALEAAEADRLPRRRDIAMAAAQERFGHGVNPDREFLVNFNRALFS